MNDLLRQPGRNRNQHYLTAVANAIADAEATHVSAMAREWQIPVYHPVQLYQHETVELNWKAFGGI